MKYLREICATVVLTCVFALSAHAGEISCPGIDAPPDSTVTTNGEIECGIADAAFIIIESVLSLA